MIIRAISHTPPVLLNGDANTISASATPARLLGPDPVLPKKPGLRLVPELPVSPRISPGGSSSHWVGICLNLFFAGWYLWERYRPTQEKEPAITGGKSPEEQIRVLEEEVRRLERSDDEFEKSRARVLKSLIESLRLLLPKSGDDDSQGLHPAQTRDQALISSTRMGGTSAVALKPHSAAGAADTETAPTATDTDGETTKFARDIPSPNDILDRLSTKNMDPNMSFGFQWHATAVLGAILSDWESPDYDMSNDETIVRRIITNPDIPSWIRAIFFELAVIHALKSPELGAQIQNIVAQAVDMRGVMRGWSSLVEDIYRRHVPYGEAVLQERERRVQEVAARLAAKKTFVMDEATKVLFQSGPVSSESSLAFLMLGVSLIPYLWHGANASHPRYRRHLQLLRDILAARHIQNVTIMMAVELIVKSHWELPLPPELLQPDNIEALEGNIRRWYANNNPTSGAVMREAHARHGVTADSDASRYMRVLLASDSHRKGWNTLVYLLTQIGFDPEKLLGILSRAYLYTRRIPDPDAKQHFIGKIIPALLASRPGSLPRDVLGAYNSEGDPSGRRAATLLGDCLFDDRRFLFPHELKRLLDAWHRVWFFVGGTRRFLNSHDPSWEPDSFLVRVSRLTKAAVEESFVRLYEAATGKVEDIDPLKMRRLLHHMLMKRNRFGLLLLVLWGLETNHQLKTRRFKEAVSLLEYYESQGARVFGNILSSGEDVGKNFERIVLKELAQPGRIIDVIEPDLVNFRELRPDIVVTEPDGSKNVIEIKMLHFDIRESQDVIAEKLEKAAQQLGAWKDEKPDTLHRQIILGIALSDPARPPSSLGYFLEGLRLPEGADRISVWYVDSTTFTVARQFDLK